MSYQNILFHVEGSVAAITFNRPEKLNALNPEMLREIKEILVEIKNNPDIRALILTGAGRAFIAGADIQEFTRMDALAAREFSRAAHEVGFILEALDLPVIAAVNGFALGGGLEMALACDLIFAADRASFGQPEINLGIIPGFGGTQRLSRAVGKVRAKDLILTGRTVEAAEALAMGLVARVFPAAALLDETRKVAQSLAQKGRVALAAAKHAVDRGFDTSLATGCALEIDAFSLCFASPDAREGAAAFLEKRAPKFA
jgi:enoyl-CoA hydratase